VIALREKLYDFETRGELDQDLITGRRGDILKPRLHEPI
jgi:hypothetical protein